MANVSIQTGAGTPPIPISSPEDANDPTLLDRIEALESAIAALQAANIAFLTEQFEADIAALQAADVVIEGDVDALEASDTAIEGDISALESADVLHAEDIAALQNQINPNMIANPGFEAGTTGYGAEVSATIAASNAAGVPYSGTWGLVVTTANFQYSGVRYDFSDAPVVPGSPYTFSAFARLASAGSKAMSQWITWYDVDDFQISSDFTAFTLDSTTYADDPFSVTSTAPAGATYCKLYLITDAAVGVFDYWTDGWQFEEGSVATELNTEGDVPARVAVLEAMAEPGDNDGFFHFGDSSISTEMREAGYDRTRGVVLGMGGLSIEAFLDSPNIWFLRSEDHTSATGYSNATTLGRIGFVPLEPGGASFAFLYNNGSDGEVCNLSGQLILVSDGATLVGGYSRINVLCINELETVPQVPRTMLMISGENGGEIWGTSYDSAGAVVLTERIFPHP